MPALKKLLYATIRYNDPHGNPNVTALGIQGKMAPCLTLR
jgi:hypothetical protein